MTLRMTASLARARLHRVTVAPGADDALLARYARGAWSALIEPGDGVAGRLIAAVGPVAGLELAVGDGPAPAGVDPGELARARARWRPRADEVTVGRAFEAAARAGARLLTPEDEDWPARLDDLGDHAPPCLWVRGDTAALAAPAPAVALVGARAATGYGIEVAAGLATELVAAGVTVVSGAAHGVDGAAHRAALAGGGTTTALLAGGVDRPYPVAHTGLLERVVRSGAIASEVACGTAPTRWRFLMRNRLIAALSDATVVVEAGWRSGSLNTAGHAATLGRPLGAVPGPVTTSASAGCHRLLREYDAHCVTSADDVLELLGLSPAAPARAGGDARPPTDERSRVADALSARVWRDLDDIARRAGLSLVDAQALLGLLHLDGIVETEDGRWRLRPRVDG